MSIVHMLIGIPGSGKTTFALKLAKEKNIRIISSDVVRNMHPDWKEELIFPEVYRLCSEILSSNCDLIYDATNITPKVRQRFIDALREYDVEFDIGAYYFETPLEECLKRVEKRNTKPEERFLPIDVISSYASKIVFPKEEEKFLYVKVIKYATTK